MQSDPRPGARQLVRDHAPAAVRAYAAINVLAGVPNVMLEADLNVGLAITR